MAPTATPPPGSITNPFVAPAGSFGAPTAAVTPAASGLTKLLPAAQLGLAGIQAGGILKRGRESQEIAEQRAAIDAANALAVRETTVERAKILAERGERLKARQKAQFISGGIRTNVGVPLLVEAQTRADIAKDIGFSLDVGRAETGRFLASAEREKRIGKFKRKRSIWDAVGVGAGAGLSYLGLTR